MDLTDTYGYRNEEHNDFHWGAQGILNLARGGTHYIYAADLLEGGTGWTQKKTQISNLVTGCDVPKSSLGK